MHFLVCKLPPHGINIVIRKNHRYWIYYVLDYYWVIASINASELLCYYNSDALIDASELLIVIHSSNPLSMSNSDALISASELLYHNNLDALTIAIALMP